MTTTNISIRDLVQRYAECRLISSSTRAASIGNIYYFKDGLYLVEEELVKAEPVTV